MRFPKQLTQLISLIGVDIRFYCVVVIWNPRKQRKILSIEIYTVVAIVTIQMITQRDFQYRVLSNSFLRLCGWNMFARCVES